MIPKPKFRTAKIDVVAADKSGERGSFVLTRQVKQKSATQERIEYKYIGTNFFFGKSGEAKREYKVLKVESFSLDPVRYFFSPRKPEGRNAYFSISIGNEDRKHYGCIISNQTIDWVMNASEGIVFGDSVYDEVDELSSGRVFYKVIATGWAWWFNRNLWTLKLEEEAIDYIPANTIIGEVLDGALFWKE